MTGRKHLPIVLAAISLPALAAGCSQTAANLTGGVASMVMPSRSHGYSARDKECLMRAMFFESNRSSRDGLIAVGTVVMNRLRSGKHGDTICAVVSEKGQFAPGVMTRQMNSASLPDVEAAADAVLKGERHAKVKNAMYFHTAGLKFKYKNMHYTVVAGGNAFYERRDRNGDPVVLPPDAAPDYAQPVMIAEARMPPQPVAQARPNTQMAADETEPPQSTMPAMAMMSAATAEPAAPAMVAMAETPDPVLPMAIDGPTPSARPAQAVEAFFPPEPGQPAAGRFVQAAATDASIPAKEEPAAALAFHVDQDDADAIGAMLASGGRPQQDVY